MKNYYSPVDYQGGLQYAELEEEVGNFHLNNIMNGMSPSMLINFNNGVPNEEERELIEQRISQKFSGSSNAGKFILAFNDNADTAASIDPVQLSDAVFNSSALLPNPDWSLIPISIGDTIRCATIIFLVLSSLKN